MISSFVIWEKKNLQDYHRAIFPGVLIVTNTKVSYHNSLFYVTVMLKNSLIIQTVWENKSDTATVT